MILGLDISTTCTGVTILDYAGKVILNTYWKHKGDDVYDKITDIIQSIKDLNTYPITAVYIEENLQSFRSGFSSASTILSLAKFNGTFSFLIYKYLSIKPKHISVGTARKTCGIKVIKGIPAKQQVMDWMLLNQTWFKPSKKKNSENLKDHYYDMADSYVLAKAGLILEKQKDLLDISEDQ